MSWESVPSKLERKAKKNHTSLKKYDLEFEDNGSKSRVRAKSRGRNVATSDWHRKFNDAVEDLADRV